MKVKLELDFTDAEVEQFLKDKKMDFLIKDSQVYSRFPEFKNKIFASYINDALSKMIKEALLNPIEYKRDKKIDDILLGQ